MVAILGNVRHEVAEKFVKAIGFVLLDPANGADQAMGVPGCRKLIWSIDVGFCRKR
jgi:hypothetical protein